jgi:hypothetical protein
MLAGIVLVLVPGGELVAWNQARRAARSLDAALPTPHDWVDRAVGAHAAVDVITAPGALPAPTLAELRLWNRSLRSLVVADPALADSRTGVLPIAGHTRLTLAVGLDVVGDTVGRSSQGSIVRVVPPFRIADSVQGLYPDGWSGADVTYRRFSGEAPALRVTISRKAWGGPEVPGAVSVISSPIDGTVTARRDTVVHSGQEVVVDIPVPPAPFEVDVHVETFSPSSFGLKDARRLGAQLAFEYPDQRIG